MRSTPGSNSREFSTFPQYFAGHKQNAERDDCFDRSGRQVNKSEGCESQRDCGESVNALTVSRSRVVSLTNTKGPDTTTALVNALSRNSVCKVGVPKRSSALFNGFVMFLLLW